MDWIKKNYDRFTLALLALALLASAWVLWSNVNGFAGNFDAAMQTPVEDNKVVAVDTAKIDEARERFEKPVEWKPREAGAGKFLHSGLLFTSEPYYLNKVGQLVKPEGDALHNDSLTGKPIPNPWFMTNRLPLLDMSVPFQDPDGDGFLNQDEWRANTDPNNKESHPAYETKLFLRQWLKQPFRFKFQGSDYEPNAKLENVTFQINPLDAGGRTKFVKIGEDIEGTKFKVTKFEFKEVDNPGTGDTKDVSELTLTNTDGETVVLILDRVIDSPTQFAEFEYFWGVEHGKPGAVFQVRKLQQFALKPKIDPKDLYKLLDVNHEEALIQRPNGENYQVPPVPKK